MKRVNRRSFWAVLTCTKPPPPPQDPKSSTVPGMVRVVLLNGTPIPLTLTLSHGEREQSAAGSIIREVRRADTRLGFKERQRRILPLPRARGEGRGEGNGDTGWANHACNSHEVRSSPEGPYGFEPINSSCVRL